ncbi:uncharacterized protein RSE6_04819 [Rhynchosporium secalis]|uniref:Uncharacterized protein n=1 Tax=Rhynchosporium secalis TaxID=38038 RepID=A0A1E1M699_RHYSE|nr:uncharacterized protein RSE6_04819 [Rhynchosporium secalis]
MEARVGSLGESYIALIRSRASSLNVLIRSSISVSDLISWLVLLVDLVVSDAIRSSGVTYSLVLEYRERISFFVKAPGS